jgi:hypothetical protein
VGTGLLLESISDAVPFLKDNIAQIATCLERLVDNQERLAGAEMEKNAAIGEFLQNLNQVLTERILPMLSAGPGSEDRQPTRTRNGSPHTKEEVIAMIRTMRDKRSTFAEIADHLKSQGIPTFSGRGEWHAQTIHRLCK